jgi:SWI/SNF-related matrix-associated actin-dependent regulator of chromatin subfamily A member 5
MIQHGAEKIINAAETMSVEDDIEDIIRRGEEKTQELNSKYASLNFDELQIFNQGQGQGQTTTWEGEEYGGRKKLGGPGGLLWIEPTKRERKQTATYNIDTYYSGKVTVARPGRRGPRGPRRAAIDDFKFFPHRLQEIQEKEALFQRVRPSFPPFPCSFSFLPCSSY